ncbi:ataxin-3 [Hordeum vulgare]|nr:ataxin-3 [Hordeum vulgare]
MDAGTGNSGMLYHELQARQLCGLHALNAALQGPFFSEGDLLQIAADLDAREREVMSAAGTVGAGDFLAEGEGSHNVSNSGDFSVEVLKRALEVWNLQFISMHSQAAAGAQSNPELETAFICHFQNHWFCIRNVDGEWYNFNSLCLAPEHLSQFLLSAYLDSMRGPGSNIYVVRGTFPRDCPTDYNDFGQWLDPEEARIITHSRFEAQQKQGSNSAIAMASRRYLTVGVASGLRGLEVPGTKIEVPRQQPYQQKGMTMMQEESDDELKAAIAISLMPFEAPWTSSLPAQEERNLKSALGKDTSMEEPVWSNSEGPVEED